MVQTRSQSKKLNKPYTMKDSMIEEGWKFVDDEDENTTAVVEKNIIEDTDASYMEMLDSILSGLPRQLIHREVLGWGPPGKCRPDSSLISV